MCSSDLRDLVSEPGNILHPDEYAKRIRGLKKNGLKINIYEIGRASCRERV